MLWVDARDIGIAPPATGVRGITTPGNFMCKMRNAKLYTYKKLCSHFQKLLCNYISLARSHLQYANSVWYPNFQRAKQMLTNWSEYNTK